MKNKLPVCFGFASYGFRLGVCPPRLRRLIRHDQAMRQEVSVTSGEERYQEEMREPAARKN
jgi:hypothetical protein